MTHDRARRFTIAAAAAFAAVLAAGLPRPTAAQPAATTPPARESSALDDLPRPWLVGLALQTDEHSAEGLHATFGYGAGARTWLSFSAGESRSPAEHADVTARTLRAAIDRAIGDFGFVAALERYGDPDALETDDVAAEGYFRRGRVRVGVTLERRDIEIPFTVPGPPRDRQRVRTAQVGADGVALDVRFPAGERWLVFARASDYDYERELAILPRIDRLRFLSRSALTLAYGFVDEARSLSAERELGRKLVTLTAARDRSAVDGAAYRAYEAALLFPAAGRLDMEVSVGRGRSSAADAGWYAGLLLIFYGGG